jgi:hypothetical protein
VSALGNGVKVHKGLFGFGKTEGQDILGDSFTSNKNPIYRNTNVDLSGVSNLIDKYFAPKNTAPDPSNFTPARLPSQINEPAERITAPVYPDTTINNP